MRRVHLDEIRTLRPHLRGGFIGGSVQYNDQDTPGVELDDKTTERLVASGAISYRGGQRVINPHRVVGDRLTRDLKAQLPDASEL